MKKRKIRTIYVPCPNDREANAIAREAIGQKLAACANVHDISSLYLWEGKIQHEEEKVLLLKTLPGLAKKLSRLVTSMHSYDCPCLLTSKASVNIEYFEWMKSVLRPT